MTDFSHADIVETIRDISRKIDQSARTNDWDYLTELFGTLSPHAMETVEIITYLRAAAPAKVKISTWGDFLDRSRAELTTREGKRVDKLLIGLSR